MLKYICCLNYIPLEYPYSLYSFSLALVNLVQKFDFTLMFCAGVHNGQWRHYARKGKKNQSLSTLDYLHLQHDVCRYACICSVFLTKNGHPSLQRKRDPMFGTTKNRYLLVHKKGASLPPTIGTRPRTLSPQEGLFLFHLATGNCWEFFSLIIIIMFRGTTRKIKPHTT